MKRELLSLIGVLQHASAVARYVHCFLHRMIDLSTTVEARAAPSPPPEQRILVRSAMVVYVLFSLEWSMCPHTYQACHPRHHGTLLCLWLLGVWCHLGLPLDTGSMALGDGYHSQRAMHHCAIGSNHSNT